MKHRIIITSILFISLFVTSSFLFSEISAQEEEEEEDIWDFKGVMRVQSDERRILITDASDLGLNSSVQGYNRPPLYFAILGLDTNEDEELDIYYGFYGISFYDVSHYGYTTAENDFFKIVVNAEWKLRIPEESSLRWEVLYYPDPLYQEVSQNLEFKTPIYYVNLTKSEGTNLEYRIDFGLNYTIGNFTTFGENRPLVPDIGPFPGYNVSVPLFNNSFPIEELVVETNFFGSGLEFISIISVTFMIFYFIRKRRKRLQKG